MGNPVMHFQMCAEDVDAMSAFYRKVERVERLGGHRRFPGTPPESVELAGGDGAGLPFDWQEFEDPEGNLVGLIQR